MRATAVYRSAARQSWVSVLLERRLRARESSSTRRVEDERGNWTYQPAATCSPWRREGHQAPVAQHDAFRSAGGPHYRVCECRDEIRCLTRLRVARLPHRAPTTADISAWCVLEDRRKAKSASRIGAAACDFRKQAQQPTSPA